MIGHITYLSPEGMSAKFDPDRLRPRDVPTEFEKKFSVGSYLGYQGDKFVERFDANSYVSLSMAMDLLDLGSTAQEISACLAPSRCRWLVVSFSSDWLFPPRQSRDIVGGLLAAGKSVSYCNIQSGCGHDAFLLPNEAELYGNMIAALLTNVSRADGGADVELRNSSDELTCPLCKKEETSIFHEQRLDYRRIVELIEPGTSVLDLGCGTGTLLSHLGARGCTRLLGVELGERSVLACMQSGLDVIQADLEQGLAQFAGGQFDCVVLSQTLQAVRDVEGLLDEILRVGRKGIVSFPNFGYHKLRRMLYEHGRAPEGAVLCNHWYNTPNLRFFTIADFEDFCAARGIRIERRIALDTESQQEVAKDANLNADLAIFVVSRSE